MKKRGKRKFKFSKIHILLVIGLLMTGIISVGLFAINRQTHSQHDGDYISLKVIDGSSENLQDAIINKELQGSPLNTYGQPDSIINPGHSFSEIWVSVNGVENTLEDALEITGICGNQATTKYNSVPDGSVYHYASDIDVSIDGDTISLQDAIDETKICCIPDCSCNATTCVGSTCTDANNCGIECEGTKPVIQGVWTGWSWSTCSKPCGDSGIMTGTRTCINTQCGGTCVGSSTTTSACNRIPCVLCLAEDSIRKYYWQDYRWMDTGDRYHGGLVAYWGNTLVCSDHCYSYDFGCRLDTSCVSYAEGTIYSATYFKGGRTTAINPSPPETGRSTSTSNFEICRDLTNVNPIYV